MFAFPALNRGLTTIAPTARERHPTSQSRLGGRRLGGSLFLRAERQSRTDVLGAPGAEDGDCDDGDGEDQKEHVAGEGDRLGAGNDRRLHEGVHAVQECAASSDAERVQRRPCAAMREQPQPNEKSQIDGEHEGGGGPVPFP